MSLLISKIWDWRVVPSPKSLDSKRKNKMIQYQIKNYFKCLSMSEFMNTLMTQEFDSLKLRNLFSKISYEI